MAYSIRAMRKLRGKKLTFMGGKTLGEILIEYEHKIIREAVKHYNGDVDLAAVSLRVTNKRINGHCKSMAGSSVSKKRVIVNNPCVYLLNNGELYKIGHTKNFKNRIKSYKTHSPNISVVSVWNINNPEVHERSLHEILNKQRVSGEWFSLDGDGIETINDYFKLVNKTKDF